MSRKTWTKAVLKSAKEESLPKAPWTRGARREEMIARRKADDRRSA